MAKAYWEKLQDPRWQRRRLEILQRSNFKCEQCGSGDKTLHVHHIIYRKGVMPWEYPDRELYALCKDCHLEETQLRAALDEAIAQLKPSVFHELLGYAEAEALKSIGAGQLTIRSWYHGLGVVRSFNIRNTDAVARLLNNTASITFECLSEWSVLEKDADVSVQAVGQ